MTRTHRLEKRLSVVGSIGLFLKSLSCRLGLTSVTAVTMNTDNGANRFAFSSMQVACEMALVCAPIRHTREATRASAMIGSTFWTDDGARSASPMKRLRKRMPDECLAVRLNQPAYL